VHNWHVEDSIGNISLLKFQSGIKFVIVHSTKYETDYMCTTIQTGHYECFFLLGSLSRAKNIANYVVFTGVRLCVFNCVSFISFASTFNKFCYSLIDLSPVKW
jgi:hypothetical protein